MHVDKLIWVKMSSVFTYNDYISETPPKTEELVPRTSTGAGRFMSR